MAKIRLDYKPIALRWPAGNKYRIRFDYESHNEDAYRRILNAIEGALKDPPPEPTEKASRIGFTMDHESQ